VSPPPPFHFCPPIWIQRLRLDLEPESVLPNRSLPRSLPLSAAVKPKSNCFEYDFQISDFFCNL
jgi:hypothetical protein